MIFFPQHFNSEMASTQCPSMLLSLDLLLLLLVLLSSALSDATYVGTSIGVLLLLLLLLLFESSVSIVFNSILYDLICQFFNNGLSCLQRMVQVQILYLIDRWCRWLVSERSREEATNIILTGRGS